MNAAGIVLYNPDIHRLKENIDAIKNQVDTLILIDNGSSNSADIVTMLRDYPSVVYASNGMNCGIAVALNQIIEKAAENHCKWVLTLDQDSVCYPELVDNYNTVIKKEEGIALLSCLIKDRNVEYQLVEAETVEEIDYCITSGTYTNVSIIQSIGGFDEKMFIDMVDYDICYAIRKAGYKVARLNRIGILHEVGKSEKRHFLGKTFVVFNHTPIRKYYWVRNSIYLMRKYRLNRLKNYKRILGRMVETILFETNKTHKIKAELRGLIDGYKMEIER